MTPTINISESTHPAWPAFMRRIQGLECSNEHALELWRWFRDGWDAKINQLWHASTDEWCDTW